MSRFFDDLEAQLHDAAVARTAGRRRPPRGRFRPLRRGVRHVGVLAATLVALAVAAVVLTMIGSGGTRQVRSGAGHLGAASTPPVPPQLESQYVNQVINATISRDPACAPGGPALQRPGGVSNGKPSQLLLSILGVLRRPATAADKLPPSFHGVAGAGLPGAVYIHYIRLARVENGVPYYLAVTRVPGSTPPPRRCLVELRSAAERKLPGRLPRSERRRILRAAAEAFAPGNGRPTRPYDSVFLIGGSGGTGGDTPAELEKTGLIMTSGRTISGLVPDGVATVLLPQRPAPGHPDQTLTAHVINNVFVVKGRRVALPTGMVWLSRTRAVIKRVNLDQ